jgi:hypothetical protein
VDHEDVVLGERLRTDEVGVVEQSRGREQRTGELEA